MSITEDGLTVLWRGSLASCNYGCTYCPFAKTFDDRSALDADRLALQRFTDWAVTRTYPLSILFTPWGEALIRNYYREAIVRLSHAPNIPTVAIQTNLSCSVDWIKEAKLESAAFWTTFHPGETARPKFLKKIRQLQAAGARYSVGVVGLLEHLEEIESLRRDLPEEAYLWVNAYKREPDYYRDDQAARFLSVDPFFELNNRTYESFGRPCRAGEKVISVLADGTARRCHFIAAPIGNIYDAGFEEALRPRPCTVAVCRCHIGYSHLEELDLTGLFGRGFLERRPDKPRRRKAVAERIAAFTTETSP